MESWIRESPVMESGLDPFQPHDIEQGLEDGGTIIVDPLAPPDKFRGPYIFKVEGNDSTYFQLHKTRLIGKLKVVKDEDDPLPVTGTHPNLKLPEGMNICNYLPQALFKVSPFYTFCYDARARFRPNPFFFRLMRFF